MQDSDNNSSNIYADIPDQFTKYENQISNPFDYFTSTGEFNLALFNQRFRQEQLKRIAFYRNEELKRLKELNSKTPDHLQLHKLSVEQHIFNMKKTLFDVWNDICTKDITVSIITRDNRIFYIGMFLVFVFILWLVLAYFIASC